MAARFSFQQGEKLRMEEMPYCIPLLHPTSQRGDRTPKLTVPAFCRQKQTCREMEVSQPKPTVVERHTSNSLVNGSSLISGTPSPNETD